jgi:hypothetical protein
MNILKEIAWELERHMLRNRSSFRNRSLHQLVLVVNASEELRDFRLGGHSTRMPIAKNWAEWIGDFATTEMQTGFVQTTTFMDCIHGQPWSQRNERQPI